mmetsp:Transcript_2821/g.3267  ORF Transcript_2821/g.3267 Transcript_2821/m.3267 type:complete len:522 (+) Transcript_2821:142-1707(+)
MTRLSLLSFSWHYVSLVLLPLLWASTSSSTSLSFFNGMVMIPTVEAFSKPSSYNYNHFDLNRKRRRQGASVDIKNTFRTAVTTTTTNIRHQQQHRITARISLVLSLSLSNNDNYENENEDDKVVWSPTLRRIMVGIASLGAIETGYLTYAKLLILGPSASASGSGGSSSSLLFCGSSEAAYSSCDQVLNGPYSNIPFFDNVPLSSLGFVAYLLVGVLALNPLLVFENNDTDNNTAAAVTDDDDDDDDTLNRIVLTTITTTMGTFSILLMILLFYVLHQECPYCIFSAGCSILLANIALFGGCLPTAPSTTKVVVEGENVTKITKVEETTVKNNGTRTVAVGFASAIVGAVLLFSSGSINTINKYNSGGSGNGATTLLASISGSSNTGGGDDSTNPKLFSPPKITSNSSQRALELAKTLKGMDAKMYGAYWCSHCYDQKQTLGKQVFDSGTSTKFTTKSTTTNLYSLEYVECAKDGYNSQTKLCKSKEIQGYPTWEIQGKLYPGEQELDELEILVKDILLVK